MECSFLVRGSLIGVARTAEPGGLLLMLFQSSWLE